MTVKTSILTGLSLLLGGAAAFPFGIRVDDLDALATARGNAFTATADTPAAVYYNPAGITQIDTPALSGGAYAVFFDVEYRSTSGEKHQNKAEYQHVPHVYFTLPVETTPFTIGFSTHVPFGLVNDWPDDTNFSDIATESEFRYIRHSPVLAWEITPGLSIGAGLTLNDGEADLRNTAFGGTRLNARDQAFGYILGTHWEPSERHAFGITYRSRTTFDLAGTMTAGGNESPAEGEFPFPDVAIAGYSFRPTPAWNFEFNVDWTNWEVLDRVNVRTPGFPNDQVMDFHWESSFIYKLGATRFFDNGYRLSAGYMFSENSIPDDDHFNPAVPDSDRHLISTGIGYTYAGLSWDVAYQFGYASDREVRGSPSGPSGGNADGNYDVTIHAFSGTVSYAF